jgi:hypothetical protein
MNLQEVGLWGMEWIDLDQDRGSGWVLMNVVTEPLGFIKYGEFLN